MARDDEDTIESQILSTSLEPYGQLIKMLMPRALCIGLYDPAGLPLWLSDSCDSDELQQLVDQSLATARTADAGASARDGFARSRDGNTAYVFLLRHSSGLLGAVAASEADRGGSSRPFSLIHALLRPALQVLARELTHQAEAEAMQDPSRHDRDPALLAGAEVGCDSSAGWGARSAGR